MFYLQDYENWEIKRNGKNDSLWAEKNVRLKKIDAWILYFYKGRMKGGNWVLWDST